MKRNVACSQLKEVSLEYINTRYCWYNLCEIWRCIMSWHKMCHASPCVLQLVFMRTQLIFQQLLAVSRIKLSHRTASLDYALITRFGGYNGITVFICLSVLVFGLCPEGIFWTAALFVTKLGMVVYHHESVSCRKIGLLSFRSRSQLYNNEYDCFCYIFWTNDSFANLAW